MIFCDHAKHPHKEDISNHSSGWAHVCDLERAHEGQHACACGYEWTGDVKKPITWDTSPVTESVYWGPGF